MKLKFPLDEIPNCIEIKYRTWQNVVLLQLVALTTVRKCLDFVFTQQELFWLDHLLPEFGNKKLEKVVCKEDNEVTFQVAGRKNVHYIDSPYCWRLSFPFLRISFHSVDFLQDDCMDEMCEAAIPVLGRELNSTNHNLDFENKNCIDQNHGEYRWTAFFIMCFVDIFLTIINFLQFLMTFFQVSMSI